jgi:hypothetical protein
LELGLLLSTLLALFLSGLLFFGVGIAPVGIDGQPEDLIPKLGICVTFSCLLAFFRDILS